MNHASQRSHATGNMVSPMRDRNGATVGDGIVNSFSSMYECPITQEPPAVGATFMNHEQVFEYSALYRLIATTGDLRAYRYVLHPTSRESVLRVNALNEVHHIGHELQAIITEERVRRGLGVIDSDPITEQDRTDYEFTMRLMQDE